MLTTEQIWQESSDELRAFIARRVAQPQDAEDILQETFLKIHAHLGRLNDAERLAPWLYRITENTIIDYYRRRKPLAELPDLAEIPAAEILEPVNQVEKEVISWLKPMLASLPNHYSEAIWLAEYEGLTQRQVAERLNLSISGAKSRVQRGRAMLKQQVLDCCALVFDSQGGIIDYRVKALASSQICEDDVCDGEVTVISDAESINPISPRGE
ncbi:MAG: RNA polymerase sigma factor SigZ [Caldilineales bacterium]|nr:RNA polymerase sigma factor SigZ [Caldilineales bacterium]